MHHRPAQVDFDDSVIDEGAHAYPEMKLQRGQVGEHTGYVLDEALAPRFMSALESVRTSLPIDSEKKKTAAARRFFCAEDNSGLEWVRTGIVRAVREGLDLGCDVDAEDDDTKVEMDCVQHNNNVRVLPWMRFLEYTEPNGSLGPHTDALIRCKLTNEWSTHTLLVFCSDCEVGGETTLLPEDPKATRRRERDVQKARKAAGELRGVIARIQSDGSSSGSSGSCSEAEVDTAKRKRLDRLNNALSAAEIRATKLVQSAPEASYPVKPKRGRIFFFPHECFHEGRPTVSVPKIFLRAELILKVGHIK